MTAMGVAAAAGDRAGSPGERLAAWMERHAVLCVAAVLIAFLEPSVRALFRPMWFDELFTYFISRLPSVADMLRAIPPDGQPPLNYFLARLCLRVTSPAELAVRIPALVETTGALVAMYLFVRRRMGAIYGLMAMLVFLTGQMAYYGVEARPYGLMLGFTGLALVSWQAAADEGVRGVFRWVALTGVAAGIAGAVASHHYGIFHVGVPIGVGECVRLMRRRRLDFAMYAACAVGLSMLAVTLPFAAASHRVLLDSLQRSQSFWARPGGWHVFVYGEMVAWWAPLVAFGSIWVSASAAKNPERRAPLHPFPWHETAALAGLALLLVVMLAVTRYVSGVFMPRYAIGSAAGVAMLIPACFARFRIGPACRATAAALCVVVLFGVVAATFGMQSFRVINGRMLTASEAVKGLTPLDLESVNGVEPIVMASAISYLPVWWYSSDALRARLHYLADVPYAVRQPDFLPEVSLVEDQKYVPAHVDEYRTFTTSHRRFFLYCTDLPRLEWTKARLANEGWTFTRVYRGGADELFEVEAP